MVGPQADLQRAAQAPFGAPGQQQRANGINGHALPPNNLAHILRVQAQFVNRGALPFHGGNGDLLRVVDIQAARLARRLEVTAISPTSAADERRLVFDPTNLTDGIALSADPMLLVRSTAYSLSYDERSQGA